MPDEFRQRPPARVVPFVVGIMLGLIGTTFFTVALSVIVANVINQFNGNLSPTPIICSAIVLLGLALGAFGAIRRVAADEASSGKYFLMGILAGACVVWLLMGACFGIMVL